MSTLSFVFPDKVPIKATEGAVWHNKRSQYHRPQDPKMGFKIRAGMAMGGLAMSYFFGITFLSGIASHLDTTGNILVDIADGIGLVSKVSWH